MNVAFIPVRGGSKSISLKNIKLINGKPLVYWATRAACECEYIDKVYISTDNEEIKSIVNNFKYTEGLSEFDKIQVIDRSTESATDTAQTETALLEFARDYDFDNVILIQATSPLLLKSDIDNGFKAFNKNGIDSVLSVVRQKRFHWIKDENGYAKPVNYDLFSRPRRQDFEGYLFENGAFYITSKHNLLESKNRISGNIGMVEMTEDTYYEIDEPDDWVIVESLMNKKMRNNEEYLIPEIKMFLTDCDGCLTDAGMYYSEFGDELKKFNAHDGMGFELLRQNNILTGIITRESVDLNRRRAKKLKLDILEVGCIDKVEAINKYCKQYNIKLENVLYIGDDINDLEAIKMVGYGCCPADAVNQIKKESKYISKVNGGCGVIRDIVDKILGY